MSDPVVIGIFETRLDALDVEYLDTLNKRPSQLPDQYISLERDFSSVERITIGQPSMWRELGSLTVVVNVRSGTGSATAATIGELARNLFFDYKQGHLYVITVGSGTVLDPDDGGFFQMKFPVQYQFDFFK
jgi:hypothetical protein